MPTIDKRFVNLWLLVDETPNGKFLDFDEINAQDAFNEFIEQRSRYNPDTDEYEELDDDFDVDDWLDDMDEDTEIYPEMVSVEVPIKILVAHLVQHEEYRRVIIRELRKLKERSV